MPRGDRTGPMGMGMRTGRGAGYCSGIDRPGYATADCGWRYGSGGGRGRGFRGAGLGRGRGARFERPWRGAWPHGGGDQVDPRVHGPQDPETEMRLLAREAEDLQTQLNAVQKRLKDIDPASVPS